MEILHRGSNIPISIALSNTGLENTNIIEHVEHLICLIVKQFFLKRKCSLCNQSGEFVSFV